MTTLILKIIQFKMYYILYFKIYHLRVTLVQLHEQDPDLLVEVQLEDL